MSYYYLEKEGLAVQQLYVPQVIKWVLICMLTIKPFRIFAILYPLKHYGSWLWRQAWPKMHSMDQYA